MFRECYIVNKRTFGSLYPKGRKLADPNVKTWKMKTATKEIEIEYIKHV